MHWSVFQQLTLSFFEIPGSNLNLVASGSLTLFLKMKNSTLFCFKIQVLRYQQGFPGAIKYWQICLLGGKCFRERLDRFGEDHNSNCFVHDGIEGYINDEMGQGDKF